MRHTGAEHVTISKVLFVVEKWAECNPTHPLSNSHHLYIGSLEASDLAKVDTFFFDEVSWQTGKKCDTFLLEKCRTYRPDLIYMTMVQGTDLNPRPETLARIRDEFDINIVASYGDTYSQKSIEWIEEYTGAVTLNLIVDNYSTYKEFAVDPSRYFDGWTPQHPDIFYEDRRERTVDVSFIGSVSQYPRRKLAIGFLLENEIGVFCRGGQLYDHISIDDYADYLRMSKISLNFPHAAFSEDEYHCKGRVIEITLCGALLIEQENQETRKWFEPGIDYVDYKDERDLLEKTKYYLANPNELKEIAARGAAKAASCYSADMFWKRCFQRVLR